MITVSIPCFSIIRQASAKAYFIHPRRASGRKKFPRMNRANFCSRLGFPSLAKPLYGAVFEHVNFLYRLYAPLQQVRYTFKSGSISVSSEGSRIGYSAKAGSTVRTTGQMPKSGRYFTNFNQRCTPGPPDGGQ